MAQCEAACDIGKKKKFQKRKRKKAKSKKNSEDGLVVAAVVVAFADLKYAFLSGTLAVSPAAPAPVRINCGFSCTAARAGVQSGRRWH